VTNSTLWGNSAASGAGFYNAIGSGTTLQNTIVANSLGGGDCLIESSSTLTADAFNLDSDGSCDNATQKTVLEINLGALADNGGRTPTHTLLPGSVAIDAADDTVCSAAPVNNLDQRSFARPQGTHCDIGAFEAEAVLPVLVVTNTNDGGAHSLSKVVDDANAGAGGTIELAPTLSGETINLSETLVFEQEITLNASNLTEPLTIKSNNDAPLMVVRPGANVVLEGLRVEGSIIIERIDTATMSFKDAEDDDKHGKLKVKDSIFRGAGGTIEHFPTSETVTGIKMELADSIFTGGIYNAGELEIIDSTFEGFYNAANGGGLYNAGSMLVANSTFKGNQSDMAGGAIYNDSELVVVNSTFSDNLAAQAGGIYNAGILSLFNSTFSNSGIHNEAKGLLNYANTILANAVTGADCVNKGALGFDINNLIEDGSCSASLSGDPLLAPLADNGGPTLTLALLPGSPAIDAGNDATCAAIEVNNLDQRGETRPKGLHCDIGAYEYDPAPTVVSIVRAGSNATAAATVDFTVTFSETVTGVDAGDFNLTTSANISSAAVSGVSGSGSIYTVTVNTGNGNGSIRLNVVDDGTIIDLAANHLVAGFSSGESYIIIKSATFSDVPLTYWASNYIERLYYAGITGGCGISPLTYCPDKYVTRAEMAVFLLKGIHGPSFSPPPATGLVFADVPTSHWAAAWIEQLSTEGITAGCGNGNYCPNQTATTRSQMAVFLLRSKYGSKYVPPAPTGIFNDVPTDYWAAAWIEQLAAEGITGGCGNGNYCPEGPLTRAEMAVFMVRTFNLP
jgi:hypothetical protein